MFTNKAIRNSSFLNGFHRVLSLILLTVLASYSIMAAGTLDPNFGAGGKVSFRFGATTIDSTLDAALQPDGKIVIVGITAASDQSTSLRNFAVARLSADGTLDNTFGNSGKVITDFENAEDYATAVVIQPDGKIIAGGGRRTAFSGNSLVFALARYNSNGTLDTSFGAGGKVVTDIPQPDGIVESISYLALQTDGKILAIGSATGTSPAPQTQVIVTRYNSNGTLDTSFGTAGIFKIAISNYNLMLGAASLPDDRIIAAVQYVFNRPNCTPTKTSLCSDSAQVLLSFKTAGQQIMPDRRFGRRQGRELIPYSYTSVSDLITKISVQPSRRIFYLEKSLQRIYTPSGRLAGIFDPASISNQSVRIFNLAELPNGTVAGCGSVSANGSFDLATVLYTSEGRLIATDARDFFGGSESCSDLLAQPDNKIIVIGNARTPQGENSFAVMRYLDIVP